MFRCCENKGLIKQMLDQILTCCFFDSMIRHVYLKVMVVDRICWIGFDVVCLVQCIERIEVNLFCLLQHGKRFRMRIR